MEAIALFVVESFRGSVVALSSLSELESLLAAGQLSLSLGALLALRWVRNEPASTPVEEPTQLELDQAA